MTRQTSAVTRCRIAIHDTIVQKDAIACLCINRPSISSYIARKHAVVECTTTSTATLVLRNVAGNQAVVERTAVSANVKAAVNTTPTFRDVI